MKAYRFFAMTLLVFASLITMLTGCKYDVTEPMWDKPAAGVGTATPVITQIVPADSATAGVNTITIEGQNFADVQSDNLVCFGNVPANIISSTSTAITVLRPNLTIDTCTVSLVSNNALVVAKKGPYKVNRIIERFGAFVENLQMNAVAIDNAENLYVIKGTTPFTMYKITPAGDKTTIGVATRAPSDAKIGPDGNLYYFNSVFPNTKEIRMVNVNAPSGGDSLWYTTNPVKNVISGDFASNGYLYTGGRRSGIVVIRPNRTQRADGYYATDTIQSVRVFNNYLYVAIRTGIWRHSISDTSLVGAPEQVLDLTQGIFASHLVKAFSFSADGSKMYIGSDSPDPILVVDMATKTAEILYKGIIPNYCKQFCLGTKMYATIGSNTVTPAVEFTVYRIDVGATGAPYY
jgi:hypothetical protein